MTHRLAPLCALVLLPLAAPFLIATEERAPLDLERDIATLLPDSIVAYVDGSGLSPVLSDGLEHPFVRNVLASEFAQTLLAKTTMTPAAVLAIGDALFGRPVLATVGKLTSKGIAFGVVPRDGKPALVLVVRGDDAALLDSALAAAFDIVENKLGLPGILDRPQRRELGADVWRLGEELVVAKRDALLVVSNDSDLAHDTLALVDDGERSGVAADARFAALDAQRTGSEALWSWLDLTRLKSLEPEKYGKLGLAANLPATQALLGPGLCALGSSDAASVWLSLEGRAAELGVRGRDARAVAKLAPGARANASRDLPVLALPDDVGHATVYRDFAAFVSERVALFPPETLPEFTKALSTISLFFGGRDVGEDVLPQVSPWLQIVSRELEYDEGRTPENRIPGAALVAELAAPDVDGPRWITAFQTLIGILNADAAQKQGGMMQLELGLEGDVQVTSARFLDPGPEDGVDVSYNLQPACAVVDRFLVLGTHEHVVRSVVRQLASGAPRDARTSRPTEALRLSGSRIAAALRENLETLVMQKVVDDGLSYEEAQQELGGLVLLAASIEALDVSVAYEDGSVDARARITLGGVAK